MAKQQATSVKAKQTVEDAFRHVLQTNLASVQAWEPVAVKGEDIEGVHQMRVGLRRMRSALTVFGPAIPRKATVSIAQEMRWAGKTLDQARDLDVYIADNLSSRGGKAQRRMKRIAMKRRDRIYDEVRDFVGGKRYAKLHTQLPRWLQRREWRKQASRKQRKLLDGKVTPFAAQVLEQHRAQVLLGGKNINQLDAEALHQLRIDCKKLRYATEFVSPLFGRSMVVFTEHLKGLQDVLGTLHDDVVMMGLQKNLLKGNSGGQATRFAGKIRRERAKQAKELRKALEKQWGNFAKARRPWKAELAVAA